MSDQKSGGGGKKRGNNAQAPTRIRYWESGRLERRKVANLVRCCGLSHSEATMLWTRTRHSRVKAGRSSIGMMLLPKGDKKKKRP